MKLTFFIFFFVILFFSCKKDTFITSPNASLYTSADTLFFDTVFTTVGSITQSFKIVNNNNQKLRLSQVKLSGGSASPFKINVNGTSGPQVSDLQIDANDSIYVFVEVNVNPSGATLPFILSDSIEIDYNGNTAWVQLQAYGQNAIFLNQVLLTGNVTWNNTLPYVILGGIQVDTNAVLNISAGTRIYLHANAPFLVDGTLIATGTLQNPVIFSGDRLDPNYVDLPASWPGIYFRNTSENNSLKHTIIQNAYQGIIAENLSVTPNPKLTLSQSILNNIYDAGILGVNTNINADNCLISNCGSNISLSDGGDYNFVSCTVASYGNSYFSHVNPVLQVSNSLTLGGTVLTASLNAVFTNCIFWGDDGTVNNEIAVTQQGPDPFSVTFNYDLYKAKDNITNATFISCIRNAPPRFDSINVAANYYDFQFINNQTSPAVGAGVVTSFLYDIDDEFRGPTPDIGCYQR